MLTVKPPPIQEPLGMGFQIEQIPIAQRGSSF